MTIFIYIKSWKPASLSVIIKCPNFCFRKLHQEKIQEQIRMDCLMMVSDQMKVKHPVSALKDHTQTLVEDLVMA